MGYFNNLVIDVIDLYNMGHKPKYIAKKLQLNIEEVLYIIANYQYGD